MTKALVTGGAGFIGSHLVRRLRSDGVQVRVLDNLTSGRRERLSGLNVDLLVGDIRDPQAAARAVAGVDWVFHLAAMVSVDQSMNDPTECYDVNVTGSVVVLEAARKAAAARVVLSSSCAVYGSAEDPVHEESDLQPLSPYASSKVAMEGAAHLYAHSFDLSTISLRYFNVYGPEQSLTSDYAAVIPKFIQAARKGEPIPIDGDGLQTRDFVYVEDIANANLLAARSETAPAAVINIGSGRSTNILELAEELQRIVGSECKLEHGLAREGDIRFSSADLERAERSLGYRPVVDLRRGLEATVEWFRSGDRPRG